MSSEKNLSPDSSIDLDGQNFLSKILLLIVTFALTGIVGSYLTHQYEEARSQSQNQLELRRDKYNMGLKVAEGIITRASGRIAATARIIENLTDETHNSAAWSQMYAQYSESLTEWNKYRSYDAALLKALYDLTDEAQECPNSLSGELTNKLWQVHNCFRELSLTLDCARKFIFLGPETSNYYLSAAMKGSCGGRGLEGWEFDLTAEVEGTQILAWRLLNLGVLQKRAKAQSTELGSRLYEFDIALVEQARKDWVSILSDAEDQ